VAQSVNPEMLTDPIYFDGTGESIPTLRWEGDTVDLEDVAAAQPDLVFVWSEEEVAALAGIAPAFASLDPANLDKLYAVTASYGRLLGQTENATAAITRFQERYQAYQQLAPKVLFYFHGCVLVCSA
jgi:ABC-type Fe3+-hydroxamate transport system substrate-binding protein